MVALSVVSSIFVISFLLFCYQLTRWASEELSGERGLTFSIRYRFLFYRLRQDRYQFGLWMMLRNVALALVPLVRPDDPYIKLLLFTILAGAGLGVQCFFWPWRTSMANVCDLVCMLLMIFVSAAASFFIPEIVSVGPDAYKIALLVLFLFGLCYSLAQLGYFLYLLRHRGSGGIICDDVDLRHELNGLWNKVMLVCSKDKSGYDFTEEMNQYELRRLSLLLGTHSDVHHL